MKKLLLTGLVACGLLITSNSFGQQYRKMIDEGNHTFLEIQTSAEQYFDLVGRGRGTGYKQYKRWEDFAQRSLNDDGYVENGWNSVKEINAFRAKYGNKTTTTTGNWQDLGPDDLTITSSWSSWIGRLTSISVDQNNTNHILVTAPTGGVWKTTDGGGTWIPLFDEMSSMDVYSSAIDPANSNNYFVGVSGVGIMYSTDQGETWSNASGSGTSRIIQIEIDPNNSNNMLLAKEWYGVYKSTDAGRTWSTVATLTDGCYDIEYKPGDPNTVYASGAGYIKKSTDGGATWTTLTGPWSTGSSDVIMMATTPDNANGIWALQMEYVEVNNSWVKRLRGIYKSTNSGTSFSTVNFSITDQTGTNMLGYESDEDGGQPPRDMDIVVSPTDQNEIHVAGITTYKSTNGGSTFVRTTDWTHGNSYGFIHADCDVMEYVGNTIYFGTDGGIFTSTDEAETFNDLTPGLNTHQLYRIGISQNSDGLVNGGSQDNGTCLLQTSGNWIAWLGADGMECFIDKSNDDYLFGTSQNGTLYRSTNGGQSRTGITPAADPGGNWETPFEQDPSIDGTIYAGFDQLYKSTDYGDNWTAITITGATGNMDELKIAPSNNQVIYAAYDNNLYKTTNGGTSWTQVGPSSITSSNINSISIDPNDPNRVALAMSSSSHRVVMTTDGGNSWTNETDNLPNITAYCVLLDDVSDNGIYVGMNGAIYYKNNTMTDFVEFSAGLPNVQVRELEIQKNAEKIYAGTYGRGLWVSDIFAEPNFSNDAEISDLTGLWSNGDLCAKSLKNLTVDVTNKGQNNITSFTVTIYDGTTLLETVNVTSTLGFNESETVQVPEISFLNGGSINLRAIVSIPATDENSSNDEVSSVIDLTYGTYAQLNMTFDSWSSETAWSLTGTGGVIQSINTGDYANDQTPITIDFCLADDCYEFEITDSYGDGLDDNVTQGSYEIIDIIGANLVTMGLANFGSDTTHSFCVPEITANFSADETVTFNCEQIIFTAATTGPVSTYNWDFGADAVIVSGDGTESVTVYYTGTGNKTVSLTVNGGVSESKTDYITVSQDVSITPTINIAITAGSNPACEGDDLTFTSNVDNEGSAPTYDWFVNGDSQSNNSTTFSFQPVNGDKVTAQLTSNEECRATDNATSNEITMQVDVCTGISESVLGAAVNIHPNPTTDAINITIDASIEGQAIKIMNNVGQVLFYDNNTSAGYARRLDMSTFPTGTYFVHISSGDYSIIRKVIKD